MRHLTRYVLDFFRERVTTESFRDESISRVLIVPGLGEAATMAVRQLFPGAELRLLHARSNLWRIRSLRFDVVCVPMAGGPMQPRLVGLLSGARHKLLLPSPEYVYRLGLSRGGMALFWGMVDRFLLAPMALLWLGVLALGMYATGLVQRASAAPCERGFWTAKGVLVVRLMPAKTFVRLLQRLRRQIPHAHLTALLGSNEGRDETAGACDRLISSTGASLLPALRQLRNEAFDAVILAGGADYGMRPTYLKAAVAARLCAGAQRFQWELGDELPGVPLGRAVGRALRAQVRGSATRAAGPLAKWARRRYYAAEPARGPTIAQIGITRACNYHCLFCPFHNPSADKGHREADLPKMSYETFARLLGQLRRMGTQGLDICGDGEPLTHPEAMEMIALARQLQFDVTLATNGALLTAQRARQLVDIGVRRMHVSMNAGTEETYRRLHPGAPEGKFEQIIARLGEMAEYAQAECRRPIEVEFSAVLNRANMHEIGLMLQAASRAGAGWLMLILMGPVQGREDLLLRPEDWLLLEADLERLGQRANEIALRTNLDSLRPGASAAGTRSVYERIPCYIGHEYALILADGNVVFCCQCSRPLGNLQQDSFEEIWKSERYREARQQARALPTSRRPLPGCECFTACSHVAVNLDVYRKLYCYSTE
jgi:MoaA/NifB/PqqE/SkfB family radical SAM enzyme